MTTQARLLRVLETGEFLKVGSSQVQKTNIRVVAATNVDLPQAIAEGRFREDLYYRLSTVQIVVPPLRDRGNDIMLLTRKFAGDFAERYRMPEIAFSDDARSALLRYRWPGNVRQLKNVIEQVALFEPGTQVSAAVLAEYIPAGAASYTPTRQGSSADHTYEREREMLFNLIFNLRTRIDELTARVEGTPATPDITPTVEVETSITDRNMPVLSPLHTTYATSVNDAERQNIIDALRRNDGRRKATAQELNISERTLYRKIREYGLE
jgi:DNA-binding NtrC family response regulator